MTLSTFPFIVFAILAWLLHIVLGWWQITQFNKAINAMYRQGSVAIGRSQGRFKPKVVIAIAFNAEYCIVDSVIMKGVTVFSTPKKLSPLNGIALKDIVPEVIFPHDKKCQQALRQAIQIH